MTAKVVISSLFIALNLNSKQVTSDYIVFYNPDSNLLEDNTYNTSNEVKFNYLIQYTNLQKSNVARDVKLALSHKDYRIISIIGYSYLYPGLEGGYQKMQDGTKMFINLDKKHEDYIKKNGFKVIKGTSDVIRTSAPPLQGVAYDYAKNYNTLLLKALN